MRAIVSKLAGLLAIIIVCLFILFIVTTMSLFLIFYHSFQLPQLELMSSYFNLFVVVVVAEESPCCGGQLAQV